MPRTKNVNLALKKLQNELDKVRTQLKKAKQKIKVSDSDWKTKLGKQAVVYKNKMIQATESGFAKGFSEARKELTQAIAKLQKSEGKHKKSASKTATRRTGAKRRGRPPKSASTSRAVQRPKAKRRGRPPKHQSAGMAV